MTDCTDFKVLLSGLVDDELDTDTRYRAERHLVDCGACRALLDHAEALNDLIVRDASGIAGPASLSEDFIGGVLGRTVYAAPAPRPARSWTTGIGWLAAAASLALAATIWIMEMGQSADRTAGVPDAFEVVADPPPWVRSQVLAAGDFVDAAPSSQLSQDDVDTLDAINLLFDRMAVLPAGGFDDVADLKEVAEYDELLPRLVDLQPRVDADERLALMGAELVLRRIVEGDLDGAEIDRLRDEMDATHVKQRIADVVSRYASSAGV